MKIILFGFAVVWACLTALVLYNQAYIVNVNKYSEILLYFPYIYTVILSYQIFKKTKNKMLWLIFLLGNFSRAFSDLVWSMYLVIHKINLHIYSLGLCIEMAEYILICIFAYLILQHRLKNLRNKNTLYVILLLNIFFILLYLAQLLHVYKFSYHILYINTIAPTLVLLFLFSPSMLFLLYGKNKGLQIYSYGLMFLILSQLFNQYRYIPLDFVPSNMVSFYRNLFWHIGVFIMMYGVKLLKQELDKNPQIQLYSGNNIKEVLLFNCFNTSLFSIIVAVCVFYIFKIINLKVFLWSNIFVIIYALVTIPLLQRVGTYFEALFYEIEDNIQAIVNGYKPKYKLKVTEFIILEQFIRKIFAEQKQQEHINFAQKAKHQELEVISSEQEKFRKSIGQLVHDMNSPLETINGTIRLLSNSIPEESRRIIKNSIQRLSGLANKVLNKYKDVNDIEKESTTVLLALLIEEVFNEKVAEYNDLAIEFILNIDAKSYASTIMINQDDFTRMLSNLINNAVEASKHTNSPKVVIKLKIMGENVILFIEDNGYGMPEHIINKFMRGESVSENKSSGHGIGLIQIFETIKSGKGEVNVYARANIGTEIMIKFPICEKPLWLIEEIKLLADSIIVIIDDEQIIHNIWDENLQTVIMKNPEIAVKHFLDGLEAINYINSLSELDQLRVYLFTDYNLENQSVNGLDIINQTQVRQKIIVSSYNNLEYEIDKYINKLQILPKKLLYNKQFKIEVRIPRDYVAADMIWLDDQVDFVDVIIKENYSHLKIERYTDPNELLRDIVKYPQKSIRIILDNYYEHPNGEMYTETGIDIAIKLNNLGFTNIIILTGNELEYAVPDYISVIVKTNTNMLKCLY